jgi:hypothetical protein
MRDLSAAPETPFALMIDASSASSGTRLATRGLTLAIVTSIWTRLHGPLCPFNPCLVRFKVTAASPLAGVSPSGVGRPDRQVSNLKWRIPAGLSARARSGPKNAANLRSKQQKFFTFHIRCYNHYMKDERTVSTRERFLLVSASTAGAPPATRVRAWRKLRSLGALYLQQSVCLLPAREPVRRQVQRLLASVRADGGAARSLTVTVDDAAEHAGLVAEFNAERDAEYAEVVERAPQLLAELEKETARGRATYAEVEESEADLDRFEKWLAKIAARDYFAASGAPAARQAVEQCRAALAAFEDAAIAAQAGDDHPPAAGQAPQLPGPARLRAAGSAE